MSSIRVCPTWRQSRRILFLAICPRNELGCGFYLAESPYQRRGVRERLWFCYRCGVSRTRSFSIFQVTIMTRRRRPKTRLGRWLRWAGFFVLGFVVASFLLVLPLRWFEPATSAFMLLDDSGRDPLLHDWIAWSELGTTVALAVVAAEDQRFADHFGLDLAAIRKAVDEQEQRGYLRGASTISQQTAKNLFLWPGRSFVRKGLEAWLTVVVEICLPKRRILEIYLNIAEFGPGIYGVGAASRYYFQLTPDELSDSRAALLAAVLPNPRRLRVDAPSDYVRERRDWILENMRRLRRERWIIRIAG